VGTRLEPTFTWRRRDLRREKGSPSNSFWNQERVALEATHLHHGDHRGHVSNQKRRTLWKSMGAFCQDNSRVVESAKKGEWKQYPEQGPQQDKTPFVPAPKGTRGPEVPPKRQPLNPGSKKGRWKALPSWGRVISDRGGTSPENGSPFKTKKGISQSRPQRKGMPNSPDERNFCENGNQPTTKNEARQRGRSRSPLHWSKEYALTQSKPKSPTKKNTVHGRWPQIREGGRGASN